MTYENTLPIEVRKKLGVWYTPTEIVEYMVKGIENLLNSKFNLPLDSQDIQILDPATGTGTFIDCLVNKVSLAEIHGIEIDPDAYEIASEKFKDLDNVKVYNLNTLEGALKLKSSKVRVVLGNPPYNGNSKNNGNYITDLMVDYKAGFNVASSLNDDYIKFIRYAQNLIDQNGIGVIAYISNNSFLSSIAMTNMRKSLLKSFDEIYILNFTFEKKASIKVKDLIFETVLTPICLYFLVKTSKKEKNEFGKVYYKEFQGTRDEKFKYLETSSINTQDFIQIQLLEPEYYFYPLDGDLKDKYTKNSFSLEDCFKVKAPGVVTACDPLLIDTRAKRLDTKMDAFFSKVRMPNIASNSVEERKKKHSVNKKEDGVFTTLHYRPFDTREYFDSKLTNSRREEFRKYEQANNQIFLAFKSTCWDKNDFSHVFVTKKVGELNFFAHGGTYFAPLYQYVEATPLMPESLSSNFTDDFLKEFSKAISKTHQDEPTLANDQTFSSLDVMDYIYGLLNDKAYTTKYNQFLKSNYPRVPYPKDLTEFNDYKDAGSKLRLVHLDDNTQDAQSTYNATTNNKIEKVSFDPKDNKVYFNKTSYFDQITQEMWNFKIGASQPLKNWLKSRKEDTFDKPMLTQFMNVIYKVRNSSKT